MQPLITEKLSDKQGDTGPRGHGSSPEFSRQVGPEQARVLVPLTVGALGMAQHLCPRGSRQCRSHPLQGAPGLPERTAFPGPQALSPHVERTLRNRLTQVLKSAVYQTTQFQLYWFGRY